EDNYLLQKLFRALFQTHSVDHCARLCHASTVAALGAAIGSAAMSNTALEVFETEVALVAGSNTTENHPVIGAFIKRAVAERGVKLIVVDPRRIELADYATLWLPLKPGTNVPLFSAMAHVIIKEGWYNEAFVREHTEGFEEFAQAMEKFTPEYAEQVTGVPKEHIVEAARLYAQAGRAMIFWGMGMTQFAHGTASVLSLVHLALLTGHVGKPGTGLNPLRGQNNVQGASDVGVLNSVYPGYMKVSDPAAAAHWEKVWNLPPGTLPLEPGLTVPEIIKAIGPDGVRALYIMGENPLMSEPNLAEAEAHLREAEFIVVQDLFLNETAAYADVFLPAASFAEKDGTFTNTDRRVQRVRQAIAPRGEARPDWQILADLAQRIEAKLGLPYSAGWSYTHPREIWDEIARAVPAFRGISYDRIERVGLQWPVPSPDHPGTPYLYAQGFPRGKGRFFPLDFVEAPEPASRKYPFTLTTGRLLEHWHGGTLTRHSELDALFPMPIVEIHPIDAEALGIADGDPIRVSSRRGSVVARAHVTTKTTPGVLFLPFHFVEAAANLLTLDALDPQAKIPHYKATPVRVDPAPEEALANPVWLTRGRR
ncbi:MAG: molybdopterin-dependent oxidoreductase, partial [Chloroflexi bacterium]|nr:molybdopterin-dependent oxidoreductase [Chloroflexota bacterium]